MDNDIKKYQIGHMVQQPTGFKAFIPETFPPKQVTIDRTATVQAFNQAVFTLGKLDGITQLLPDLDFFLFMYVRKEAALSSNIEGTQATMMDAIRVKVASPNDLPKDVENIVHYISALNLGMELLNKSLPLSLRLIKELHKTLLAGTDDGLGKTPGEFRVSQNWIGGATIENAKYVPPPAHELTRTLRDFEAFMHDSGSLHPLAQIALSHAQFETIHPFLDGNGRVGRLLIPIQLCHDKLLEKPVLYLSAYFKKYREVYFAHLTDYHDLGVVDPWLHFFFVGVKEVAESAIHTAKKINELKQKHESKIDSLDPRRIKPATKLLQLLFTQPIIDASLVKNLTGLSLPSSIELIRKFEEVGILIQRNPEKTYAREYEYYEYLALFTEEF